MKGPVCSVVIVCFFVAMAWSMAFSQTQSSDAQSSSVHKKTPD